MGDSDDLLRLDLRPLVSTLRDSLMQPVPPVTPRTPSVLCGLRGLRKPAVALYTIKRLGPVRHALAQRAVVGTVEVHAPWATMLARGEEMKKNR